MTGRPVIAFCGMTHLGLCSAAAAALKGFETIGFDPDPAAISALKSGVLPVNEPGLAEAITASSRLHFTADPRELARCDLAFVASDVPTDAAGRSDLSGIAHLIAVVGPALAGDTTLVILSQVPPGFTRAQAVAPPLFYQVETLIFGRALQRALEPERIVIGCPDAARPLPAAYADYLAAFACPILPMALESAELTKIAINAFLVSSIATTNMLAELAEATGARWSEIAPALRLDARIGPKAYLMPGLGLGGSNLDRDLTTIAELAGVHGTEAGLVPAWRSSSRRRRHWTLRQLHAYGQLRPGSRIAVLGLAYKEDTASTRNSPALALIEALGPYRTIGYDPVVTALDPVPPGFSMAASHPDACRGADVVAVMTPWSIFRDLDAAELAALMRGRLCLDPYGLLDAASFVRAGFDYHRLGHPAGI